MDEIKPIKRSKELTPLSHEHHDGLQFVWNIRQGLENNAPVELIGDYVRWFWINHIKPHFNDEEKVLMQFLPADNRLVKQMLKEHSQIRDMILSLDHEPEKGMVKMLADFIYKHIRFEERKLFPWAERTLTPEQLTSIYQELAHEPLCNTDPIAIGWKEQFWLKKQ